MLRTLFLVLCAVSFFQPKVHGAIEIYANGHKYDSLQAYQASKKSPAAQSSQIPVSLNSQQEDYIRQQAQKLGFYLDFSKVKTFQVNQGNASGTILHKLCVLSVENGVAAALQDFYQARGPFNFQMVRKISSEQLQKAIQQAVTTSKGPKLLISEPGKVRIMAMSRKDPDK